jgi:hypothetical protein
VCDTYLKRVNDARKRKRLGELDRLEFQHWSAVKQLWNEWTDIYLTSPLHIVVCGRAGYEWDFEERDDGTGKKDLVKTGVKMKVEGEFGYESSILVQMTQDHELDSGGVMKIARKATVLKDRFGVLDGVTSGPNPTFEFFEPHVSLLRPDQHVQTDFTRQSEIPVNEGGDTSWRQEVRAREILCEEIKAEFVKGGLDGNSAEAKRRRVEVLEQFFGTASWTAVEQKASEQLRFGLEALRALPKEQV